MSFNYQVSGSVATLTLDNPPVNVLTPMHHKCLLEILREFVADKNARVCVWTGAGDRAFCAGDDIKTPRPRKTVAERVERQLGVRNENEELDYPGWESEVLELKRYKPIIGAVRGHCLGQGLIYLLLLTDIRIAAENASLGLPEIKYGMGGAGGILRLSRQIPHAAAMWMLLTGEPYNAQQAKTYGLVNEVVPEDQVMNRAMEIAEIIAAHPPLAIRTEMEAYYRGQDMTRDDAIAFSSHLYRMSRLGIDQTNQPLATKTNETSP